jgi:hypothetical protein
MTLPYRPLGVVKQLLEEVGMDITYAYEDLVFIRHNPCLLQFGREGEMLFFYASVETGAAKAKELFSAIQAKALGQGIPGTISSLPGRRGVFVVGIYRGCRGVNDNSNVQHRGVLCHPNNVRQRLK